MESKNMSYAFQVEYQNHLIDANENQNINKDINKDILEVVNNNIDEIKTWGNTHVKELTSSGKNCKAMYFKIQYPGMLIGTGYPHQTGKMTGEIQVGFSFDYVTGAPYYPGSSLKGIIRDVFEQAVKNDLYLEYFKQVLGNENLESRNKLTDSINHIFGQKNDEEMEGMISVGGDIFYGAYVVGFDENIIGLDTITPHGTDLTKNPVPINMLRIMPDVTLAVVIDIIKDEELEKTIFNCDNRRKLYQRIIEDFGIGAKRNVGYGNVVMKKEQEEEKNE